MVNNVVSLANHLAQYQFQKNKPKSKSKNSEN
jgi:hypothetical protein